MAAHQGKTFKLTLTQEMHTRVFFTLTSYRKFLPAAKHAGLHVHFVLPSFLPGNKRLKEAFRGQKGIGTWVIEATVFKFEAIAL